MSRCNATRRDNAARAGIPANFFVANPDYLGGAEIVGNGGYTKYNSLQLELRKRLTHGLQFQSSYVFGKAYSSERYSFRTERKSVPQTGTVGGVPHAFKANWTYELPFGEGRRFGGSSGPTLGRELLVFRQQPGNQVGSILVGREFSADLLPVHSRHDGDRLARLKSQIERLLQL